MMKEREELIRSEYDKALSTKLAGEFVDLQVDIMSSACAICRAI